MILRDEKSAHGVVSSLYKTTDPMSIFEVKRGRARTILNRYISLGSSTQIGSGDIRQRVFPVIHYSLTGLEFEIQPTEEREELSAIIASKREQSVADKQLTIVYSVPESNASQARAFLKSF